MNFIGTTKLFFSFFSVVFLVLGPCVDIFFLILFPAPGMPYFFLSLELIFFLSFLSIFVLGSCVEHFFFFTFFKLVACLWSWVFCFRCHLLRSGAMCRHFFFLLLGYRIFSCLWSWVFFFAFFLMFILCSLSLSLSLSLSIYLSLSPEQ